MEGQIEKECFQRRAVGAKALRQGRTERFLLFLGGGGGRGRLKANFRHVVERDEAVGEKQSPDVQGEGLRDERQNPGWKGALTKSSHLGSG